METTSNNKRIAKNTIMLYIRMLFVMAVSIFTSRIILEKLGVTDYGIYNSVGAVVAMMAFLNNTLSLGTSRFLTYEIGTSNKTKLIQTFSTSFYLHLILAFAVVLILVAGGTWFVSHKLIIPKESLHAAIITFYLSVFTAFISITQVPYTSVVIAHEKMDIYAYIGVFEAIAKLAIAYAISFSPINRLVFYAILMMLVQFIVAMAYRIYCIRNYEESKLKLTFKKAIFKDMMSFSSWNLIANIAQILGTNGIIVLINMFFVPAVAAAQAVAVQISNAMMQFVNNFRTAVNPQIIKLYASGEYKESRELTLNSTVYTFALVLLIGLPLITVMDPIIHIWLTEIPPYAVIFSQLIIVNIILGVFNNTLYTPMLASGNLKANSIACVFLGIGEYLLLYLLLKIGFGVLWVQYLAIIQVALFSLVVKPYILIKQIGYSYKEIANTAIRCAKISIIPFFVYILLNCIFGINSSLSLLRVILIASLVAFSVLISTYINIDKTTKEKLLIYIKHKLNTQK